jgi:hypothetical protein
MQIQCCVERSLLEEQEGIPDKEADVVKFTSAAIPWYGNRAPLPPPPPSRIVTSLPRTVSNATTIIPTN